jgi:hypothetical protein
MALDRIFQGQPSNIAAGNSAQYAALGLDTVNNALYVSAGQGWVPATGAAGGATATAQAANNANVLTFTAQAAGLYKVNLYEVSTTAPTAATLPAITVVYTDADSATAVTDTLASVGSVGAKGVVNQGDFAVSVAAGGTIVIATTSYAAGSGTALAYAIRAKITYLG